MKKLLFIILALLIAVPAYPAQWNKLLPASTDEKINWPTMSQANNDALDRTLQGYREGLRLTYSSASTLVVTAGQVWVSNATGTVRLALSNAASTNVTFTDIDTGAEEASKTYYVYAIADAADSEAATFKISANATAPTGATYYKKIGSFYNNSDSNITLIDNDSEEWEFGSPVSRTAGTAYQALTDGIVYGKMSSTSTFIETYMSGYTDSASTPTTEVQKCYIDVCDGCATAVRIWSCSISFPVKAGDYYKVTAGTTASISFVPKQ